MRCVGLLPVGGDINNHTYMVYHCEVCNTKDRLIELPKNQPTPMLNDWEIKIKQLADKGKPVMVDGIEYMVTVVKYNGPKPVPVRKRLRYPKLPVR
jgi:hypothetical protein